ncbi:MAG: carbon monoxide dehydrogenase [Planctomycetaceae bacterium]|nr:carbon monoxide dehydrogenase [Planctomycetaceae bacterium]
MHDFDYEAPVDLDTALRFFAERNGSARVLAGGTDLIDQIRLGRYAPDLLVDIKKLPELNVLECQEGGLRLGAAVPCSEIYRNETVVSGYEALVDSCRIIGGIQVQNRASVGGNLCNSGPAADSPPSLIVLGARCVIASAQGQREVPAEEFCTGPGENVLQQDEVLIEIRFSSRPPRSGSHYRRFTPRNEMDIAVVGVGASVTLDETGERFVDARIALGAVAPTPLFAREASESLTGQPVNDETIARAAELAQQAARPIDDMRGTKEFRIHVTGVLTRRVLAAAIGRARGEEGTRIGH